MTDRNFLTIMTDGHDPRYLGAAGNTLIHTPALDRLAARGTQFTNAYTPCPICVPARASFATGRHVHETECWDNAQAYDGSIPGWAQYLRDAGRSVEAIGKMHYRRVEDPLGYDRQHEPMHIMDGIGMVWGAIRDPFPKLDREFRLIKDVGAGVSNYNLYDRRIANRTVEWLQERAKSDSGPWALYVGFAAPHPPFIVPQEYLDHYPPEKVPMPKAYAEPGTPHHPWIKAQADFIGQDKFFKDDEERRLAYASYLGLLSFIDAQVGFILDALAQTGFEENTHVLYTSDHGDSPGARGLWGKFNFYEESGKVPMILAGPDVAHGKCCETPVTLIDCHATILDGMGVTRDQNDPAIESRSLFELASAPVDPERVAFSQYHAFASPSGGYMLRRGRYKYHYYVGYPPELFDLVDDPEELQDLADDPAHKDTLTAFEDLLRERLDPEATDRQAKAAQAALIERHGGPEKAKNAGAPGTTPVPGYGQE